MNAAPTPPTSASAPTVDTRRAEVSDVCLVLVNCPDEAVARSIAEALVREQLAACVNQWAPCTSTYQWDGKMCSEPEIPLLIKTTGAAYAALEARVKALHPYDCPEIMALPIVDGLPAYLDWVRGACVPRH